VEPGATTLPTALKFEVRSAKTHQPVEELVDELLVDFHVFDHNEQ
jgi:hypothetical protein